MKINARWLALIVTFIAVVVPSIVLAQGIGPGPTQLLSFSAQPTVYIGYLSPNKATTLSLGNYASNTFGITSLEQSVKIQGVWTELLVPVKTSSPLGLLIDFGYLFPSNTQSEETYNLSSGTAARNWNTNSQLWNFQVAATYHMSQSMTGIMGFRYDSFMTNYKDPENQVGNLNFRPVDIAEFNFNGYIPFLGVMIEKTTGTGISLKGSVIGVPALFGSFVYKERVNSMSYTTPEGIRWNGIQASNEFASGYFLEAQGELSVPLSWWIQAGAFVKYSGVYGKTTTVVNTTTDGTKTPNLTPPPTDNYAPANHANGASVTFERSSWIVGGTMSASF